jgi:hypothetical protein
VFIVLVVDLVMSQSGNFWIHHYIGSEVKESLYKNNEEDALVVEFLYRIGLNAVLLSAEAK